MSLIFTTLLTLLFIWGAVEATTFTDKARFFPLYISIIATIFVITELMLTVTRLVKKESDSSSFHPNLMEALKYMGWMLFLLGAIYLVGFKVGAVVFLGAFLYFVTGLKLRKILVIVAVTFICMYIFGDYYMNLHWPGNLMNW